MLPRLTERRRHLRSRALQEPHYIYPSRPLRYKASPLPGDLTTALIVLLRLQHCAARHSFTCCDICGTISRRSPPSLWGVSAPTPSLSLLLATQAADWSVEALTAAAAAARAVAGGSTVDGVDAVTCSCSHRSSAASVWRRMLGGGCCSSATPFAAWLAPSVVSTPAAAPALIPVAS